MTRLLWLAITGVGLLILSCLPGDGDDQIVTWPASVLMTNDDGLDTPGIRALAEKLADDVEVYVVAPAGNRSGTGNYVSSLHEPMSVVEADWGAGFAGVYAVGANPADGIVWGLEGLLAESPPDLVISGINDGANAGSAWITSGTIGAARMAAFMGVPAVAVSGYDDEDPVAVDQVAAWLSEFVRGAMVRALRPGEYLLVNMPRIRMEDVKGVVVAPLDLGFLRMGVQRDDEFDVWVSRIGTTGEMDPDGDWAALREGKIVITPMRVGEMNDLERFRDLASELSDPRDAGR